MKFFLSLVVWLGSLPVFAAYRPLSAKRRPSESYRSVISKIRARVSSQPDGDVTFGGAASAYDSRVSDLKKLNVDSVSLVSNLDVLQEMFVAYRDLRYLADPDVAGNLRRISWQYPDDGCFVRAELFGYLAERDHRPAISKIFVFGDLEVATTNAPSGSVSWWYHVAPLYKIDGGELYVMDPAVEPQRPLTRAEWAARIGERGTNGATTLQWAVCSRHAFDPSSNCQNPPDLSEASTIEAGLDYLKAERARAVEMGRNPDLVLGDEPPWFKVPSAVMPNVPAPAPVEPVPPSI